MSDGSFFRLRVVMKIIGQWQPATWTLAETATISYTGVAQKLTSPFIFLITHMQKCTIRKQQLLRNASKRKSIIFFSSLCSVIDTVIVDTYSSQIGHPWPPLGSTPAVYHRLDTRQNGASYVWMKAAQW